MNKIDKMREIKRVHARSNNMVYNHLAACAYEYITYLLQHISELKSEMDLVKEELFYEKRALEENHAKYVEQYNRAERKDEALRRIEEELTDDTSEKAQRINEIIARASL